MRKKFGVGLIASAVVLFLLAGNAAAAEIFNDGEKSLDVGFRVQQFGMLEYNDNARRDDFRVLLFNKDIRLKLGGLIKGKRFGLEIGLGGEAADIAGDAAITAVLLDAWMDVPLKEGLNVRAGQFKMPYSRERLADSGSLQFTKRSINTLALNAGRDIGVAVYGNMGNKTAALGVFTGGGINKRIRNIPLRLGIPMVVLRVGINTLDEDIFTVKEVARDREGSAVYINALYSKNSKIGHGNVLGQKSNDVPLLLNTSWNNFWAKDLSDEVAQAGVDFAMQRSMGDSLLTFGAEVNYGTFRSSKGNLSLSAGTVRAGLLKSVFEIAARYAVMLPDDKFENSGINFISSDPIHVFTPAVNLYFEKHDFKILMDLPVMIDVPVVTEDGLGVYNIITQPGQVSYATETIERRTTVMGRIVLQLAF